MKGPKPMINYSINMRMFALNVLYAVLVQKHKAKASLEYICQQHDFPSRDAALLREMVYGVLRHYFTLEADVSRFIKQKPEDKSRVALLLGAYQLRHMRIPNHAAVSETVAAIKPYAPQDAGFINAVLRKVSSSEPPTKYKPHQRVELPKWMYSSWRDALGADAVQTMMDVCQQTPNTCIAVLGERSAWIEKAEAQGFSVQEGALSPYAILLAPNTNITTLPEYDSGGFIVMDQAPQVATLAVSLAHKTGRILDLCAAPGGKTALLAHRFPKASITAVELNPKRIPRLQENMARLTLANVEVIQADASSLPYADNSIDAIMLDAPCSASGTLRRHPDAKFLHDKTSVEEAVKLQTLLLKEALRVLKIGGTLVYAVCSIHKEENEAVVNPFKGVQSTQRLLPSDTHDGFFFAQIIK
ncbi:MAG TPA: methyltransferase domain-containing protein [Mariprofundaceae bacterium]|nr:methyltransferase domain-containing protein [Mariprofundaceae bacterium]